MAFFYIRFASTALAPYPGFFVYQCNLADAFWKEVVGMDLYSQVCEPDADLTIYDDDLYWPFLFQPEWAEQIRSGPARSLLANVADDTLVGALRALVDGSCIALFCID